MGSARFSIQAIIALTIAALFCPTVSMAVDIPDEFPDTEGIAAWAANSFFGGNRIETLKHDDKEVVVILGSSTSGLNTASVLLYLKTKQGYELVAYRSPVMGAVKIETNDAEVRFKVRDIPILIVPWKGMTSTWPVAPKKDVGK
jgi:hypothetical protein